MRFAVPPISKLKRGDWQFVIQTFTPILLALIIVSLAQCSQRSSVSVAAPVAQVKTSPEPIPVTLQWPRSFFRTDLSYRPEIVNDTPLGHTGRTGTKVGKSYVGYELWMMLGDGKVEQWFDFPYCNENVPILLADWEAHKPPFNDGCDGCEGPPTKLLGYRSYCGPRRYYSHEDCTSDSLGTGGEFLFGLQARGYRDNEDKWHDYDRARVECRPVKLDEYPVSDFEYRDVKALAKARRTPPVPTLRPRP